MSQMVQTPLTYTYMHVAGCFIDVLVATSPHRYIIRNTGNHEGMRSSSATHVTC